MLGLDTENRENDRVKYFSSSSSFVKPEAHPVWSVPLPFVLCTQLLPVWECALLSPPALLWCSGSLCCSVSEGDPPQTKRQKKKGNMLTQPVYNTCSLSQHYKPVRWKQTEPLSRVSLHLCSHSYCTSTGTKGADCMEKQTKRNSSDLGHLDARFIFWNFNWNLSSGSGDMLLTVPQTHMYGQNILSSLRFWWPIRTGGWALTWGQYVDLQVRRRKCSVSERSSGTVLSDLQAAPDQDSSARKWSQSQHC